MFGSIQYLPACGALLCLATSLVIMADSFSRSYEGGYYKIPLAPCQPGSDCRDPDLGVQLGVDIGDVLSKVEAGAWPEHYDRWRFALEGAYVFMVFFVACYGGPSLSIISRTNRGSWWTKDGQEVWVVQFLRDAGFMYFLNERQVRICKYRPEKGGIADEFNLSHFIDNHPECLASVIEFDDPCCIQRNDGFMVHFNGCTNIPVDSDSVLHERTRELINDFTWPADNWFDVAILFGLVTRQDQEFFDERCSLSPPNCAATPQHDFRTILRFINERRAQQLTPSISSRPARLPLVSKRRARPPHGPQPSAARPAPGPPPSAAVPPSDPGSATRDAVSDTATNDFDDINRDTHIVERGNISPTPGLQNVGGSSGTQTNVGGSSGTQTNVQILGALAMNYIQTLVVGAQSSSQTSSGSGGPGAFPFPPIPHGMPTPEANQSLSSQPRQRFYQAGNTTRAKYHNNPNSDWAIRKRQRAAAHNARQLSIDRSAVPVAPRLIPPGVQCVACDMCAPAARCSNRMCGPCCLASGFPCAYHI